ncbi:Mitochondrial distribution and morphology protein 12 [Escovopsis weberi]|uniref:Mitochondrial distribution and morphology protein 12 n=1 Tax=Escovopsis weberi TaxID=150374 RepID=A0A0M9VS93_ESCWE|nr:Mitochondrial distribution and morphology protein 12 [Escovopsis weberi]
MSIDLNWETLTGGPDGDALAERIRVFIHSKFQTVQLPRFIRSVNVHGFDFGTVAPQLALKDITDPLPDFYEQDDNDDDEDSSGEDEYEAAAAVAAAAAAAASSSSSRLSRPSTAGAGHDAGRRRAAENGGPQMVLGHDFGRAFLTSTPGILGGPGRNYFQHQFATGTQTPLAAVVAGAHMGTSWMGSAPASTAHTPSHSRKPSMGSLSVDDLATTLDPVRGVLTLSEKSDVSTMGPPSRPSTRDAHMAHLSGTTAAAAAKPRGRGGDEEEEEEEEEGDARPRPLLQHMHQQDPDAGSSPRREARVEDVQAVFRIRYSGDVRLNLTAEILLDYPMPSFVGIPLKLSITGLSFDGVGVLAYIRKKVHFCFLSPEDALAAVGDDDRSASEEDDDDNDHYGNDNNDKKTGGGGDKKKAGRFAGLLQEIRVESEIGERDGGKQSLKNVGKVERFVLEQVRRIFEEEFVYPSFWTFLV